jgi:hypothetical protein
MSHATQFLRQSDYCTVTVNGLTGLESEPAAAVTVTVYEPAGVPFPLLFVVPVLEQLAMRRQLTIARAANKPHSNLRRFLDPIPAVLNSIAGNSSQTA